MAPQQPNQSVNVIVEKGMAMLVDPQGTPIQVPTAEVVDLLSSGYRPEGDLEFTKREELELIAKDTSPLAAGLMSAGSALTLGMTEQFQDLPEGAMQAIEAEHPVSTGLGTAAGIIGPAIATGGGSLMGRAAAGAGGRAIGGAARATPMGQLFRGAEATGQAVTRGLGGGTGARIAGATTREGLSGAGIGLGQAVAGEARTGEFDPASILWGGGTGAAIGVGFSGAAAAIRGGKAAAQRFVAKRASAAETALEKKIGVQTQDLVDRKAALEQAIEKYWTPEMRGLEQGVKQAGHTINALEEGILRIQATGPNTTAINSATTGLQKAQATLKTLGEQTPKIKAANAGVLKTARKNLEQFQREPFFQVLTGPKGPAMGPAKLKRLTGAVDQAESAIKKHVATVQKAKQSVASWKDKLVKAKVDPADRLRDQMKSISASMELEAKQLTAMPSGIKGLKLTQLEPELEKVGAAIAKFQTRARAAGNITAPGMFAQLNRSTARTAERIAMIHGYHRGGIPGALGAMGMSYALQKVYPLIRPSLARTMKATTRLAPVRHLAPAAFSKVDYDKYATRLKPENLESYERHLTDTEQPEALSFGMDPEGTEEVKQLKLASMQFLATKLPKPRKPPSGNDARQMVAKEYTPTPGERFRFGKYVRTVEDPAMLLEQFINGYVQREAVEVWAALYGDALDNLNDLFKDALETAQPGEKFASRVLTNINTVRGIGPDRSYVNFIQEAHRPPPPNGPPGGGGSGPAGMSAQLESPLQQIRRETA